MPNAWRAIAVSIGLPLLVMGLSSCGENQATPPVTTSASASASASVTPATTVTEPASPVYRLAPGTQINIQETGRTWTAKGGHLAVQQLGGGTTSFVATATKSPTSTPRSLSGSPPAVAKGEIDWTLTLTVGSSGKALSGVITSGGPDLAGAADDGHDRDHSYGDLSRSVDGPRDYRQQGHVADQQSNDCGDQRCAGDRP